MKSKLANKLVALFLFVSILPLSIVGWIAYERSVNTVRAMQFGKLRALAKTRADRIHELLAERQRDVSLLAQFYETPLMIRDYAQAMRNSGVSSPAYQMLEKYDTYLTAYTDLMVIQDLYLITPEGDIVFTTAKNSDLGSNLLTGTYKNTELARIVQRAADGQNIENIDIQVYPPSGELAVFTAAPVMEGDKLVGILAFQLLIEEFYTLTRDYTGLGKSGEMVMATLQGNEAVMITPTRHDPEAALKQKVKIGSPNAKPIQEAVQGKTGIGTFSDYRGETVIAVWEYLPILKIGMVLKIDKAEAFAPITSLTQWFFFLGIITFLVVLIVSMVMARSISRPIISITRATTRMAAGDLTVRTSVRTGDEIETLSNAFNNMAGRLQAAHTESENTDWLQRGLSGLDDVMRGTKNLSDLCTDIITCIARYLDVPVGTLSLANDERSRLELAGGYAYKEKPGDKTEFGFGEGLIGQAAKEKKKILLKNVKENGITISSALGEIVPESVVCFPLLYQGKVNGVIELGSLHGFTDLQLAFLDQSAERIAIAINSAHFRERMKVLLEESQAQAEELQAQQEELKVANEELELKSQEMETQQEELRVANEELGRKNAELEVRKEETETESGDH